MLNTKQLDAMSRINLSEADKNHLIDIASVHIDTSLSIEERMESYLRQIKNPYLFRSGNLTVKVCFAPNGADLGELIKRHFLLRKRG